MKQKGQEFYYTNDHEWVHFQHGLAYTGICRFKLTGFREITEIIFTTPLPGFKEQGALLAVIRSHEYRIEAHMPVAGMVWQVNEDLLSSPDLLLHHCEETGWIARIEPLVPGNLSQLLPYDQYTQLNQNWTCAKNPQ